MPLWKAAAQSLVALTERCGEDIWPIILDELKELFMEKDSMNNRPFWMEISDLERPVQEDEKTWRNPGLQETLIALQSATVESDMRSLIEVGGFSCDTTHPDIISGTNIH